jgi:hypothetical protein
MPASPVEPELEPLEESATPEELPESRPPEELPESLMPEELPESSAPEELPESSAPEELPESKPELLADPPELDDDPELDPDVDPVEPEELLEEASGNPPLELLLEPRPELLPLPLPPPDPLPPSGATTHRLLRQVRPALHVPFA